MTAVAIELLARPPATDATAEPGLPALDPDAVEVVADTDKLMTMCGCSASSDNPY
jgi:CDGSH-type Zn-finger protein